MDVASAFTTSLVGSTEVSVNIESLNREEGRALAMATMERQESGENYDPHALKDIVEPRRRVGSAKCIIVYVTLT